jgi:hypothetical protein
MGLLNSLECMMGGSVSVSGVILMALAGMDWARVFCGAGGGVG